MWIHNTESHHSRPSVGRRQGIDGMTARTTVIGYPVGPNPMIFTRSPQTDQPRLDE